MGKYIDADYLKEKIIKIYEVASKKGYRITDESLMYLIEKVRGKDSVDIVRCKDCIHYGDVGDCEVHPYDGRFNRQYFCADGEKKKD